jgi:hypothetical protein
MLIYLDHYESASGQLLCRPAMDTEDAPLLDQTVHECELCNEDVYTIKERGSEMKKIMQLSWPVIVGNVLQSTLSLAS